MTKTLATKWNDVHVGNRCKRPRNRLIPGKDATPNLHTCDLFKNSQRVYPLLSNPEFLGVEAVKRKDEDELANYVALICIPAIILGIEQPNAITSHKGGKPSKKTYKKNEKFTKLPTEKAYLDSLPYDSGAQGRGSSGQ